MNNEINNKMDCDNLRGKICKDLSKLHELEIINNTDPNNNADKCNKCIKEVINLNNLFNKIKG